MSTILGIILWSVATYFITVKIRDNGFPIKPSNYVWITILGGFMLSMSILGIKYNKAHKNNLWELICWILAILAIVIQVAMVI